MRLTVYQFGKDVPVELQEAIEDIRMLLNNGKYTPRVVTTEPTYTGEEGETVILNSGPTNKYLFHYANSAWWYVAMTAGPLP